MTEIEHALASAFHDEDWTVLCKCGAGFYSVYRANAEEALRKHIADEGLASARAALEGGEDA